MLSMHRPILLLQHFHPRLGGVQLMMDEVAGGDERNMGLMMNNNSRLICCLPLLLLILNLMPELARGRLCRGRK